MWVGTDPGEGEDLASFRIPAGRTPGGAPAARRPPASRMRPSPRRVPRPGESPRRRRPTRPTATEWLPPAAGRRVQTWLSWGWTARPPAARSPLPAHAPAITASGARPGRPQRLLVVWRACWRTAAQARSVNGRGGAGAWRPSARRRRTRQAPELAGVTAGLGAWSAWSRARAATRGRGLCAHPPRWTVRRGRSRLAWIPKWPQGPAGGRPVISVTVEGVDCSC